MSAAVLLDPARLDRPDTDIRLEPFPFLIAHGQLPDESRTDLERDFPRYASAGFFPYDASDCGPTVNALVERLTTPEFAGAIGKRLGIENLGQYPTLVTLCRSLNKRHGTIHTDSKSKVATALLYLNTQWPDTSDGCLRFLGSIDNIDDIVAPELKPLYGEFAVFKRCDNSFHGHLPYEGERSPARRKSCARPSAASSPAPSRSCSARWTASSARTATATRRTAADIPRGGFPG